MLEKIFKPDWLEKNPNYGFVIGFVYSLIAILAAYLIFPRSQGIASIAFLSLLLFPVLSKIITIEELQDTRAKRFSLRQIFKDHSDILQVYLMLFLGIFVAYGVLSIKFENLLVSGLFDSQLRVIGVTGNASVPNLNFFSILFNNIKVNFIFLVLSVIFGAGSILFLAWNASVWGTVFGYVATHSRNALDEFFKIFIKVTPHMFLEAGAYFFAIVAGGLISQAFLHEKVGSRKFDYVMKDSFVFVSISFLLLLLGAIVEVYVFPLF